MYQLEFEQASFLNFQTFDWICGIHQNDDDEDEDSVDDEYNRLHVDDPCSVSRLQLRARADHEKGLAVKRQKIYWEHWLGLRIMLQKSLSVVNSVGFLSTAEAVRGAGGKVANA